MTNPDKLLVKILFCQFYFLVFKKEMQIITRVSHTKDSHLTFDLHVE